MGKVWHESSTQHIGCRLAGQCNQCSLRHFGCNVQTQVFRLLLRWFMIEPEVPLAHAVGNDLVNELLLR